MSPIIRTIHQDIKRLLVNRKGDKFFLVPLFLNNFSFCNRIGQMEITRKGIILLYLISCILICGCDNKSSHSILKSNNKEECIAPHNPYNDGGGHDAGFNWAAETSGDCNGNSESFNEGCEEYHTQLSQYNECLSRNHQ